MISKRYIKKYIKRMFNIDVDIYIQHHFWGGYGAKAYRGTKYEPHVIEIAKDMLKKDLPRYLIWHEVGHLFTAVGNGCGVKNEVNAQMWAMQEMKKRGYNKLYNYSLEYVIEWTEGDIVKSIATKSKERATSDMYKIAGYIILNKLGAQKVEHYKV